MTTVEIIRLELEFGRSMRAKDDTLAQRLLDRAKERNREADRTRERERFARQAAAHEFGTAKRRRS